MADRRTAERTPFRGVRDEARERAHPADLLVLAAPAAAMLAASLLPASARAAATFSHAAPSVAAAYTTHFVHATAGHLVGNLGVYATVAPAAYLLALLAGRRVAFLVSFATVLGAFPFVLSGSSLLLLDTGVLLGFSGMAMALVGFLPVVTTEYVESRFSGAFGLSCSPALFFLGVVVIVMRATPPTLIRPALAGVAAGGGLLYLRASIRSLGADQREQFRAALGQVGYVEALVLALLLFFIVLFAGFPSDPIGDGWVVNVYVHFLGYGLGFLAPYLTYSINRFAGEPI